ncbi:hypothetical protein A2130_00585 [Candidatus Woesebacteria bacterium GWC2_33_12]|nr:MAG: hypothetical protein A2130_00585 [Candidatus Woesebacteria bacterium GWC2_33_12]OGM86940.1 MAG: hypothetical protein A2616_00310 [Candidatus Woesebacteria bacterium RIFOXYD1_FULL_33_11]
MLYTQNLNKNQLIIYEKLKAFNSDFVLAGGTSLMLQINHRKSYDFDCFSEKPLNKSLLRKVKKVFGNSIHILIDNNSLLLFTTPQGVKVDLVYYPYKPLHQIIKNAPISLFGFRDIASNKAYTIGRRATWRDYVDLFCLLKNNTVKIENIIKDAKKRFGGEFSEKLFLEQLVYFNDLDIVPIEFINQSYEPSEIKQTLEMITQQYTKTSLFAIL